MSRRLRAVPWPTLADLEALDAALSNPDPCPRCDAGTGQRCINPITGEPMRAAHWQRIPRPQQSTMDGDAQCLT